jgi:heme/copper-type cytochrome/quinol oxidase subunit 4
MSIALLQVIGFTFLLALLSYGVGMLCFALCRLKHISALHHASAPIVGLSVLAMQLWAYGLVNIPWNRWILLAPWVVVGLLLRRSVQRAAMRLPFVWKKTRVTISSLDRLSRVLLTFGSIIALAYLLRLAVEPLLSSDTMAFWSLKAKEFFHHHAVYVDSYLNASYDVGRFFHVDYPPLWPLMADISYVLLGHMQEAMQKTTTWIFCLSATAAVWAFAKERLRSNNKAIIMAFIVLAAPQFLTNLFTNTHMAYGDYPLAMMMLFSTIFLVKSFDSLPNSTWLLALLFASLAGVIKNEGIPFLLLVSVILTGRYLMHIYRHRRERKTLWDALIAIGATVIILLPNIMWVLYKQKHNLVVEFRTANLAASGMSVMERLTVVGRTSYEYLKDHSMYWWQIAAVGLGSVAACWQRNKKAITVLFIIAGMIASYLLSFIFSPHELQYHVSASIDRLFSQLLPFMIILLILLAENRIAEPPKK